MSCKGLHCPGCGDGGGGLGVLAVIVIVVLVCAAIARPVEHAADVALHVLEIAGIVTGSVLAAGGTIWAAMALRRRRQAAPRASRALPAAPEPARAVTGSTGAPAAIEARGPGELHLHLHGMTAEAVAELAGRLGTRPPGRLPLIPGPQDRP